MEENRTDTPQTSEAQQNINAFDTAALNAFGTHQKQAVKKQYFDTPSSTKQRGGSIFQGKSILEQ